MRNARKNTAIAPKHRDWPPTATGICRAVTNPQHGLTAFLFTWILIATTTTFACAIAVRLGDDATIKDETALIVWDPQTQTEHFIRSANILTQSPDLGFLVPTPSIPTLHDTSGHTFHYLQELTAAEIKVQTTEDRRFRLFAPDSWFGSRMAPLSIDSQAPTPLAAPAAVDVISQQRVGVYDASILKASDSDSLRQWLVDHEYTIPDSLQAWLDIYVSQGWYITAFKLSKTLEPEGNRSVVVARPVRLTFQTAQPFYPYREPQPRPDGVKDSELPTADASKDASRMLRLFFLSDQRYDARIGNSSVRPAKTVWSKYLSDWQVGNIARNLNVQAASDSRFEIPSHLTILTELEDPSTPRQGTDELFFDLSSDQSYKERPPIVRERVKVTYSPDIPEWTLLSLPFLLSSIFVIRLLRRR